MLYSQPLQLIALMLMAAFVVGSEIFFHIGRRADATDSDVGALVTTLQSALLALLGLLLAFTFGMANSRFEERKSLLVQEANDIGTTWLRTDFLPESARNESRSVLKQYLDSRIRLYDAMQKGGDDASMALFLSEASAYQHKLWTLASQAGQADPRNPMLALYVSSLNDTIDVHSSRVAAARNHVPEVTLILLMVLSMGAACSIGHAAGLAGNRSFGSTAAFHFLVVLVIIAIMDIDRPRRGFIQVTQTSLLELRDDMAGDGN